MSNMKRMLLSMCVAMTFSMLNAQKIYFVYLQTENNAPFFVRMDDKLYSSSPSGYLILPRLKDTTYHFRLGFPGKDVDLDFATTINKKDHGYLVKNFGEKGWGLFDLQSMGIQMSTTKVKGTAEVNRDGNTQVDAFTEMLSKAADDPSLKQNVVLVKEEEKKPVTVATVQKEEKKPEITEAVVKEEKKPEMNSQTDARQSEKKPDAADKTDQKLGVTTAAVADQKKSEANAVDNKSDEKNLAVSRTNEKQNDSTAKAVETARNEDVYKRSVVTKISGTDTREGFESVFVDEQNGDRDTIRILIPGDNREVVAKEQPKKDSTKDDKRFLEINPNAKQTTASNAAKNNQSKWWPFGNPFVKKDKVTNKDQSATKSQPTTKSESPTKSHSNEKSEESKKWNFFGKKTTSNEAKKCEPAAHEDFLKLRRRMAEKTNDDAMLEEGRKYFKEKCFTTEQIKNLSSMFLSNAGKYNFFELALHNVTDKENFSTLQSELNDDYYVSRFKTLVGN